MKNSPPVLVEFTSLAKDTNTSGKDGRAGRNTGPETLAAAREINDPKLTSAKIRKT